MYGEVVRWGMQKIAPYAYKVVVKLHSNMRMRIGICQKLQEKII